MRDFVKDAEDVMDRAHKRIDDLCDERMRKAADWFSLRFPKRDLKIVYDNVGLLVFIDDDQVDYTPAWRGCRVDFLSPIFDAIDEIEKMSDFYDRGFPHDLHCEPHYAFSDCHFKPGDFNYRRAWHELARPAFRCLPANIRDLYELVRADYCHLVQGLNLDVVWPQYPGLRNLFEDLDSEYLAQAAAVIHNYGHWMCDGNDGGAHWRFSNLADQVLRQRLGLGRDGKGRLHFVVVEGALRFCHDTRDSWEWKNVCLATPTDLERCRDLMTDDYDQSLKAIKDADPGPRFGHDMLDTQRFIVKKPVETAIDEVLDGSGLRRHDITHVNFKPHPFVIGTQHFPTDGGMYIDPDKAPCAMRGCNLGHAEHVSDHVLVIAGLTEPVTDDHKVVIESLAPVLEAHGLDGIVFIAQE